MSPLILLRTALVMAAITIPLSDAFAHCFVGARFLPATLNTDDPCVADEMSLPTVSWSKTADVPPATEWDISVDIAKRITQDFGVTIATTWAQFRQRSPRVRPRLRPQRHCRLRWPRPL